MRCASTRWERRGTWAPGRSWNRAGLRPCSHFPRRTTRSQSCMRARHWICSECAELYIKSGARTCLLVRFLLSMCASPC